MAVRSLLHADHPITRAGFPQTSARCAPFEGLEKSDIAELSSTTINNMNCDELVRMIRVASLPDLLSPELEEHLPLYDRKVLTRLAHLAQRCCRNHGLMTRKRMSNGLAASRQA